MKERLQRDDLIGLLLVMAEEMIAAKDALCALDAAIGDGDLGVTMLLGFRAVQDTLCKAPPPDLQGVFVSSAAGFADNAPSTFGALMATMFSRCGRVIKEHESIGPAEAAAMLQAAADGVLQRGKAAPGEKTVLDALIPAAQALGRASSEGKDLAGCLAESLSAARVGAEATIGMRSRAGRSSWLGERTVGAKDPGAAALVLMLESAQRYVVGEEPG